MECATRNLILPKSLNSHQSRNQFMIEPQWKQFLRQQGAQFDQLDKAYFSPLDQELARYQESTLLCDLSYLDSLTIRGKDAKTSLQGQLTCDLEAVTEQQFQLGCYCNPKGRIISSFRLFKLNQDYVMYLPPGMAEITAKALSKYIVFSQAEMIINQNQWVCIGLMGDQASDLLSNNPAIDANIANTPLAVADAEKLIIARDFGHHSRYLLMAPLAKAEQIWQSLLPQSVPVSPELWQLWDYLEAFGQIVPNTSELFLPHNLNYQHIGAVNFNKGCYTGQEVVARMQYKGKLKSQMYLAYVDLSAQPQALTVTEGSKVVSLQNHKNQGEVINLAAMPQRQYLLLVHLTKSAAEEQQLTLADYPQSTLQIETPAYTNN